MAEKFVYIAKGEIGITKLIYSYEEEDPIDEIDMTLKELNKEEYAQLVYTVNGDNELAEYIHKTENFYGIVESIQIGVDESGSNTKVIAKKQLSKEQLEAVKDYISGQFSDGWGEGFHQYPFVEDSDFTLIADFQGVEKIEAVN